MLKNFLKYLLDFESEDRFTKGRLSRPIRICNLVRKGNFSAPAAHVGTNLEDITDDTNADKLVDRSIITRRSKENPLSL